MSSNSPLNDCHVMTYLQHFNEMGERLRREIDARDRSTAKDWVEPVDNALSDREDPGHCPTGLSMVIIEGDLLVILR